MTYDKLSIPELIQVLAVSKKPADLNFAECIRGFIASGDPAWAARVVGRAEGVVVDNIGRRLAATYPWETEDKRIAEFAVRLFAMNPGSGGAMNHDLIDVLVRILMDREKDGREAEAAKLLEIAQPLIANLSELMELVSKANFGSPFDGWAYGWERPGRPRIYPTTFEKFFLSLERDQLCAVIDGDASHSQYLLLAVAKERPAVARFWLDEAVTAQGLATIDSQRIMSLIAGDASFDADALSYLNKSSNPAAQAEVLIELIRLRRFESHPDFLKYASQPNIAADPTINQTLAEKDPELAVRLLRQILAEKLYQRVQAGPERYGGSFHAAACYLEKGGADVFELLDEASYMAKHAAFAALVSKCPEESAAKATALCLRLLRTVPTANEREQLLGLAARYRPAWFVSEWWEYVGDSSKQIRAHAVGALLQALGEKALWPAVERLSSRKADARLGAVLLLAHIDDAKAVAALSTALETEKSSSVRVAIRDALGIRNAAPDAVLANDEPQGLVGLEAQLSGQKRGAKMPGSGWLDLVKLPEMHDVDGTQIGGLVVTHLLATQASHKAISLSPELALVWLQIDRARSGDFALAVLNEWLVSPQDAKDRWVLAIAGLLGDTRILSVLNSWIPRWCEASRHKLAEYAAQAIALQGSDSALMLLDALATRYRSKFRNIGAAAAQSFQDAATMRGLSADELGDRVVPTFGFDENGERVFTWEGGSTRAELSVDLKVTWTDPESEKTLKALPASAPDELRTEAKELGKLLREAAKSQTTRLELALVRQRRWPVERWRELYETHPVLRAYATRLVWGVYAEDGALLRCFRRYPNGLLADAVGGLEELLESNTTIGMVHPLELTAETIAAWRGHLGRFKITPPFPQLERAVERLDAQHANRRELAVAKGRAIGSGTFRSRAERRGWLRGSVVDGGCVSNYYKLFPGAGVEVYLELEGMYVGIDPTEMVTLGVARFAKAGSVVRGSYTYDEPQAGDTRLAAFGDVPAVVYSETVADLKAIAGLVTDPTAEINAGETGHA